MAQLDFKLLISQAKEIDKEIVNLKAKTMEPSKFGLGKTEARKVLKNLNEELYQMKVECSEAIEISKEKLNTMKNDMKNVNDYLKDLNANLDKIETMAKKYGYQTYEESLSNQSNGSHSPNISGITELVTPMVPSKKVSGRERRKLTPTALVYRDFASSTPNLNNSNQS